MMSSIFSLITRKYVIIVGLLMVTNCYAQNWKRDIDDKSVVGKFLQNETKSASFPGGISALFKFLADSVKYPKSALAHPIKQKVGVQIDINQDGTIPHVVTPPGLRKDFEIKALRALSRMPK